LLTEWQRAFSNLIYNSKLNNDATLRTEYVKDLDRAGNVTRKLDLPKFLKAPKVTDRFSFLQKKTDVPAMFHPFGGTSMNDILEYYSRFNPGIILIGYVLMLLYAAFMLSDFRDRGVRSSTGVAIAGVLLVTLASVSGLGCATVFGIQFNAATTQIVPFLTLGLGVDDMFLLVHNYKEVANTVHLNEMGFLLKETGLSVLLTSISNILSFTIGGVIPVPALRSFCWQVAIVLFFNVLCIITIYPAILSIDLIRRKYRRSDIFCCLGASGKVQPKNGGTDDTDGPQLPFPPSGAMVDHTHGPHAKERKGISQNGAASVKAGTETGSERNGSANGDHKEKSKKKLTDFCGGACLDDFVSKYYSPFLSNKFVKIGVLVFFGLLIILGIVGCAQIRMGLELTDVVPKGTAPYDFMKAREDYFSFYLFNSIIKEDFDYSQHQRLVQDYRDDMGQLKYIVNDQGSLGQTYWLPLFQKWVKDYQKELARAIAAGNITSVGPKCHPGEPAKFLASGRAILAWKMLINEKGALKRSNFNSPTLIDSKGIIRPSGFYNYLTAWVHEDSITYQFAQAHFIPEPHPGWVHSIGNCSSLTEKDLTIPAADKLLVTQIPYFVTNLTDTPRIVEFIKETRGVCDRYESDLGMPNFPTGVPYTYWEQYINLVRHLMVAIGVITLCVFLVISVLLMNVWTGAVVTAVIAMMVLELAGLMGLIGLKMNPISAVTLVTAVGIAVEFTVHMALSFLTSLGDRNQRMARTLDHMFVPVLHGGISTLLGIIMLAFSRFEFIVRYVFVVLFALLILGLLNGLILLPVLLSLVGPPPEVRPLDGSNTLPPPSPHTGRRSKPVRNGVATVPGTDFQLEQR
jgi:hypothetical protein